MAKAPNRAVETPRGLKPAAAPGAESSNALQMRIPSDPARLSEVRAAVRRAAARLGFGDVTAERIALATDEALTNVMKHGYEGQVDQPIDICIERVFREGATGLCVTIRDFGRPFDPADLRGRDLHDVRPGGLGVHFMRAIMDEVRYEPAEDGGTRLRMVKLNRDE